MEPPKTSTPKLKRRGFETNFEFSRRSGWLPYVLDNTTDQTLCPISINDSFDASAPCRWNLSITYNGEKLEV
jgi:hypothetical protein